MGPNQTAARTPAARNSRGSRQPAAAAAAASPLRATEVCAWLLVQLSNERASERKQFCVNLSSVVQTFRVELSGGVYAKSFGNQYQIAGESKYIEEIIIINNNLILLLLSSLSSSGLRRSLLCHVVSVINLSSCSVKSKKRICNLQFAIGICNL